MNFDWSSSPVRRLSMGGAVGTLVLGFVVASQLDHPASNVTGDSNQLDLPVRQQTNTKQVPSSGMSHRIMDQMGRKAQASGNVTFAQSNVTRNTSPSSPPTGCADVTPAKTEGRVVSGVDEVPRDDSSASDVRIYRSAVKSELLPFEATASGRSSTFDVATKDGGNADAGKQLPVAQQAGPFNGSTDANTVPVAFMDAGQLTAQVVSPEPVSPERLPSPAPDEAEQPTKVFFRLGEVKNLHMWSSTFFPVEIQEISVLDPGICEAIIASSNKIQFIAVGEGQALVEAQVNFGPDSKRSSKQRFVVNVGPSGGKTEVRSIKKVLALKRSIAKLYPGCNVGIEFVTNGILVRGNCDTEASASGIIKMVRKVMLVPTIDKLEVGDSDPISVFPLELPGMIESAPDWCNDFTPAICLPPCEVR